jgi:ParB/RepB/Spo0J family partition protein
MFPLERSMQIDAAHANLQDISLDRIDRNPENPRILFRTREMEDLLESIRRYGVQVPISVYKEAGRYVLIDGERRWKCSLKLNKKTIPALVQDKPDPLTNLLLMFNIHSLREQWDLLTIALKLPRIMRLLEDKTGTAPNERQLADETGLPRAVIRRCKLLIELPDIYKEQMLDELKKQKPQQKLTEDFFIEMERALKTVERALPDAIKNKDAVRRVMIEKYRNDTISNIVHFRNVARIARAEYVDADKKKATAALQKLFQPNDYSIDQAYEDSVAGAYSERDLLTRVNSLLESLHHLIGDDIEPEIRKALRHLMKTLSRLLGPEK